MVPEVAGSKPVFHPNIMAVPLKADQLFVYMALAAVGVTNHIIDKLQPTPGLIIVDAIATTVVTVANRLQALRAYVPG